MIHLYREFDKLKNGLNIYWKDSASIGFKIKMTFSKNIIILIARYSKNTKKFNFLKQVIDIELAKRAENP